MEDRYLYRAKRKDNGEWVSGYLYGIWEKRYILWGMTNDKPDMIEVDPSTICQCTGLKDKNGKLIWENDIVKHYNKSNLPEQYDIGVIQWDNIQLRFKRTSTMIEECVCINSSCIYEVIGNIFDNPELLEVKEAET